MRGKASPALENRSEHMAVISGALTGAVIFCLFYGRLAALPLSLLCALLGGAVAVCSRHSHSIGGVSIDDTSRKSRLNRLHPGLKTWGVVCLLFLCTLSPLRVGVFLMAVMLCLTVLVGGVHLGDYLRLLALPASFVLLSCLALLWDWSGSPRGVLDIAIGGGYLSLSAQAQEKTLLLLCRAMGAVSCLYFLSLSTPIHEIIGVLRRARIPRLVSELMYLIYRYVFLLLETHRNLQDSARSRLGYLGVKQSLRTTGMVYANLLAGSYRRANACFDAMESRCYDGTLSFLEEEKPLTVLQVGAFGGLLLVVATLGLWR